MIVQTLLGSSAEPAHLTTLEICARGLIAFGFAILMVRLVARRFFSHAAPFDIVVGVMLGAALSRTVTGPSPVIIAMACAILLAFFFQLAEPVPTRGDRLREILGLRRFEDGPMGSADEPDARAAPSFEDRLADLKEARLATHEHSGRVSVVSRR